MSADSACFERNAKPAHDVIEPAEPETGPETTDPVTADSDGGDPQGEGRADPADADGGDPEGEGCTDPADIDGGDGGGAASGGATAGRPRWRRRLLALLATLCVIAAIVAALGWALAPPHCRSEPDVCRQVAYERYLEPVVREPVPEEELAELPQEDQTIEFYGIQYVPEEDFDQVKALNVDAVLQDFPIDAGPDGWLAQLDVAEANDLRVVAWLWTPGWEWDEAAGEWAFDERAVTFLETVEGHPALLAVYATHEAYWNECFGCGYTTAQLQTLYSQIKAVADVPVYSAFSSFEMWRNRGEATTFADGVCDYCDTWYYPVLADGTYDRQTYIDRLYTELQTFRELAPNSKFVWVLQGFASERSGRSMPDADQLEDMAELASRVDIDGLWWYVWSFDQAQYEEVLGPRDDLHNAVRTSHDDFMMVEQGPASDVAPVDGETTGDETVGDPTAGDGADRTDSEPGRFE